MGNKKKKRSTPIKPKSPAMRKAHEVRAKFRCSFPSPGKGVRVRRALDMIEKQRVSIRTAAKANEISYGFLYRRLSGEVEVGSRNGPSPVFTKQEETAMAVWLSEMAQRGMGLKPGEFLDFVANILKKKKQSNPFINGRPGYEWYYAFMARNRDTVQTRRETPLEMSRAKLTKEKTDNWYRNFRDFLVAKEIINKPSAILNADETGFSLGSVSGKVIGPSKVAQVPHVSGGQIKQRITVMFCGCANGSMMPPFMILPQPRPRGYNPLTGAIEGTAIAYTKKGWMDSATFKLFVQHFSRHVGPDRQVVLLIDSVSSHLDMEAFGEAKELGIEIYRIVPNATHLMQPLDKGLFGPLKQRWHQVVRKHNREQPGAPVGKENFSEKLKDAFYLFYKPLTIMNSFKSSGIYPVDSTVIVENQLKPGLTYQNPTESQQQCSPVQSCSHESEKCSAEKALQALDKVITTPARQRYKARIDEGYGIEGQSPCFDVNKKLYQQSKRSGQSCNTQQSVDTVSELTGLQMLAETASTVPMAIEPTTDSETKLPLPSDLSPVMKDALVFPQVPTQKKQIQSIFDSLPDILTFPAYIRSVALKKLQGVIAFAQREKKAKTKYLRDIAKKSSCSSKRGKQIQPRKKKQSSATEDVTVSDNDLEERKQNMTWEEDQNLEQESVWVQCDKCDGWIHGDCCVSALQMKVRSSVLDAGLMHRYQHVRHHCK